jgi:FkbM family methyltransferase
MGFFLSYGLNPITNKTYFRTARIFSGDELTVPLPAGLDLYLTGIKSHDSEIRLVKYLIKHVRNDSTVFDIGAHIGYFSLVCGNVAKAGKVHTFEPSSDSYKTLLKNLDNLSNSILINKAVADSTGEIEIYQLPQLYSEFDTTVEDSLTDELKVLATKHVIQSTSIDDYCFEANYKPDFIKIDVEGAEYSVLKGAMRTLKGHGPTIAMEVRKDNYDVLYGNIPQLMNELNYQFYSITKHGDENPIADLRSHVYDLAMESDNVILKPNRI